jgi:hypothetical protein
MHSSPGINYTAYTNEAVDAVVVTYERQGVVRNYINGLGHGGRPGYAFYYEALEALSYASRAKDILVIGYGTGSIAEVVAKSSETESITIVELSNTLMTNLKRINVFKTLLADERINVIIDDGRRFLLRSKEKYDLILIDALRTTTSHSNNVYSREFFDLVAKHLTDGGVFLVWMDEYRVIPNTVSSVFDHVRLYDYFCLASNRAFSKNRQRAHDILMQYSTSDRERILKFEGAYVGDRAYIIRMVDGYPINQDWKPTTEYFLGLKAREALMWLLHR